MRACHMLGTPHHERTEAARTVTAPNTEAYSTKGYAIPPPTPLYVRRYRAAHVRLRMPGNSILLPHDRAR